ncbi:16S rRNA (adenine(1518)-N(6)/adenine(1519)-N(6))-dimethyltransferase RsmA [Spiroplasma eriocheiris]|nr:16S rRNA (adenine(1518)-N(6)/adenine(1519)-N(6))-dimethyltransferase RsmA [Spiroplasma eriocheiris]
MMAQQNKEMITHNIYAKKRFGQNFLTNKHIINLIIDSVLGDSDQGIIEIGPGMGALTAEIIYKAAKTVAIEIDDNLIDFLINKYQTVKNFKVIHQDILKTNLDQLVAEEFSNLQEVNIISNIPYYITSPIIFKLLKITNPKVKSFVLMMQKEVGERILAQPNTKSYNNLSIVCQFYCDIEKVTLVGKNNFVPVPKVDSIVLKFTFNKKYHDIKNEGSFLEFIRSMFSTKRKTILNNLGNYLKNKRQAETILTSLKYSHNLRSENLTLNDFYLLYNKINEEES